MGARCIWIPMGKGSLGAHAGALSKCRSGWSCDARGRAHRQVPSSLGMCLLIGTTGSEDKFRSRYFDQVVTSSRPCAKAAEASGTFRIQISRHVEDV